MLHDLTPTDQLSAKAWYQTLNVNLHSVYHLVRLTFPFLRRSSNPSFTAYTCPITNAYDAAYASSKAGLKSLVECLQTEQENQKIRVELRELPAFPVITSSNPTISVLDHTYPSSKLETTKATTGEMINTYDARPGPMLRNKIKKKIKASVDPTTAKYNKAVT